jgi:hypothetical protein
MQVEEYQRPPYLIKRVLYSEKEGIFPILKAARWPERHDCALMTSKGFASRAARDLLDKLERSEEELQVFCIHDADAAGTMIYQALQRETRARPGRKVKIINLGLEPEEAFKMGLQVEKVKRENAKHLPVADYVEEEWQEWLQEHRVELNAMSTPELLEWLDRKMAEYGGKVVPPDPVLAEHLKQDVRTLLEQQFTEEALRHARIGERVEMEFARRETRIQATLATMQEQIREWFEANPSHHWSHLVGNLAETIVAAGASSTGVGS